MPSKEKQAKQFGAYVQRVRSSALPLKDQYTVIPAGERRLLTIRTKTSTPQLFGIQFTETDDTITLQQTVPDSLPPLFTKAAHVVCGCVKEYARSVDKTIVLDRSMNVAPLSHTVNSWEFAVHFHFRVDPYRSLLA